MSDAASSTTAGGRGSPSPAWASRRPAGTDVDVVLGDDARGSVDGRARSSCSTRPSSPVRFAVRGRATSTRCRTSARRRSAARTASTQLGFAAAADAIERRRRARRRSRAVRGDRRHRRRWAHHARGELARPSIERGAVAGQPVLRPDDDAERHRRRDLDEVRLDRPRALHRPPRARPAPTRSARASRLIRDGSPTS